MSDDYEFREHERDAEYGDFFQDGSAETGVFKNEKKTRQRR